MTGFPGDPVRRVAERKETRGRPRSQRKKDDDEYVPDERVARQVQRQSRSASGVGRSSARNQEIRGAVFSQNSPEEAAAKRFIARYNIQRVLEPPPMPPGELASH